MFIQCTVNSVKRAKETPLEYISEMYINPFNKNRGFVRHEFVLLTDRLSLEFIVRAAWNSVLLTKYLLLHSSMAYLNSSS